MLHLSTGVSMELQAALLQFAAAPLPGLAALLRATPAVAVAAAGNLAALAGPAALLRATPAIAVSAAGYLAAFAGPAPFLHEHSGLAALAVPAAVLPDSEAIAAVPGQYFVSQVPAASPSRRQVVSASTPSARIVDSRLQAASSYLALQRERIVPLDSRRQAASSYLALLQRERIVHVDSRRLQAAMASQRELVAPGLPLSTPCTEARMLPAALPD